MSEKHRNIYLEMPIVKEEVSKYCMKYKERLENHLANILNVQENVKRKRWQILTLCFIMIL